MNRREPPPPSGLFVFRISYDVPGGGAFPRYAARVRLASGAWREVARYVAPWIDGGLFMGRSRLTFLPAANTVVPEYFRETIAAALKTEKPSEFSITEVSQ